MPKSKNTSKQRTIYISKRCGRLANRLVIFANIIAYAEEYGLRLRNYTFHSYCKDFEATRRDFHCQYPPPAKRPWLSRISLIGDAMIGLRLYYRAVRLMSRHPGFFDGTTLEETDVEQRLDTPEMVGRLGSFCTIFVHNWKCRCPSLVAKHQDSIRDYFRPAARHCEAVENVVEALQGEAEVLVGIHIRQGDYAQWRGGRFYLTTQEYAKLMRAFAEQFPGKKVGFLVCSNEQQDERLFDGLTYANGPGHPVSDLYSLSRCDYIIGPLSTFSQWASFYGKVPLFHLEKGQGAITPAEFSIAGLNLLDG
ncbi:alpha-1,2-fucosyltransferase [Pontiellaceae bacterium B12219]|nr:alpha-1,2-fucosyltransferase [Pontiellaceae bacterium B12219]